MLDEVRFSFTQPICDDCWTYHNPGQEPCRVSNPGPEACCLCNANTSGGIYVRVEPKTVPYPSIIRA